MTVVRRIAIVAPHFAEYSERLAAGLGNRVPTWLALNSVNRDAEAGRPIETEARTLVMPMNRRLHQLATLLRCVAEIARFRADTVIVQEGVREFLKPLIRILRVYCRVVLIVHDPAPHSGADNFAAARHVPYRRWLREHADAIVVHGAACRREMVALGYDGNRIVEIDHGVLMVPQRIEPAMVEPRRVLMFGRMEAYKGLETLLDAVDVLNRRKISFTLVVAGEGPEQRRLATRMAGMDNVTSVPRYLSQAEAEAQIGAAAFVVAPYTDATQSGVLASTFANGRPVVASDVGGLGDVVSHDVNGLLVPAGDPAALADAMVSLLADEDRMERLATGARDLARTRLNWNLIAERLTDGLDNIPSRPRFGRRKALASVIACLAVTTVYAPRTSMAAGASPSPTRRFDAPECGSGGALNLENPPTIDMYGISEAMPAGALRPNGQPMSWALHPRLARGNDPRPGWTAMVGWGQVFISQIGDRSRNTRVEIRDMRLFVRPKSATGWCLLEAVPAPKGAFYRTDFVGDQHDVGDQRIEADGGRSFRPAGGQAIHFFTDRVRMPPGGVDGVYADFQARLIKDDPSGFDDRKRVSLVASAGADYWMSDKVPAGHVLVFNEDAGIGRFRLVGREWRTYSMNTNAPGAIRAMPQIPVPPSGRNR
jgi:glycosyltransferase involved in cell wall biosynthesis